MRGYEEFLRTKVAVAPRSGFDVPDSEIHPSLFGHQRDAVRWALKGGRRALFASFGLGKTRMQLEFLRHVQLRTGGQVMVVLPLGVRMEFAREAKSLGLSITYVTSDAEARAGGPFLMTNYERVRDGHISPEFIATISGVSLDEASVLRSFGSKTYQTFLDLFADVRYRLVATATPSPNRFKELIHYGAYLGVMDSGQALTRFFQRDSEKAGNLTIMPHMEREFWLWMSSWALFLTKPSDLGYPNDGYDLPLINVHWHQVDVRHLDAGADSWGQELLFRDAAGGVREAAREKRDTLPLRLAKARELIDAEPGEHWLLWHHLEAERAAIESAYRTERATGTVATVYGTQDLDEREELIRRFADGELRVLATKPEIAGSGTNLQRHCARAVFMGIDYSFNDLIQSIHRIYRFQQTKPVEIHIIYADSEVAIVRSMKEKWAQHDEMTEKMIEIIKEYGLSDAARRSDLERSIGVERREHRGELFTAVNNDSVLELAAMGADSMDMICTSIPFGNQYEYTPSYNDFGFSEDNGQFWQQMKFLIPELYRTLKPGRIAAIHVKDRIRFGKVTGLGFPTVDRFSDECADAFTQHGFAFCGRITVVTDVVRENNQTYRLGWTEMTKDGTKMGVGMPEYVLLFRKPQSDLSRGYADEPVVHSKSDRTEEHWSCLVCGYEVTAADWRDMDEGESDNDLTPLCPDCGDEGRRARMELVERVVERGYTRGQWQIDAHGYWRSSGDRMLRPDEIAGMDPEGAKRWWTAYSRAHVYDYEAHIELGRDLEAQGRLPATFMLLAPASWSEEVWDDIARMRTLNSEQSRRQQEQHVCLARGSLVLTRDGYVPIEEVEVGSKVLTHEGRWRRVQVVRNMGVRPVVRVEAQGVPRLVVTPEHELWTRKSDWVRQRDGAERVEPTWLRADATVGGYVNLKLPPEQPSGLTEQECWILGRWLADGHVGTRGDYHISVGADKLAEFEAMAGDHAGTRAERTATQVRLRGLSPALLSLLEQCGRGAAGKQLPVAALEMPADQARAVLDGYLSGDGHCVPGRDRWMVTSVSRALLLGIAMLAQRAYGAVACLQPGRPAGTTTIEGRTVATQQEWLLAFDLPRADRRNRPFLLDDGAWKRVRKVDSDGEAETWCLRVEEDASFTAEGCIVKNCPFPLDIPKRLIERFTNPGEVVLDPFNGLGSTVYMAIKGGRRGYGVELSESYWWQSVGYCMAAEEQVSAPTLFDALDDSPAKEAA